MSKFDLLDVIGEVPDQYIVETLKTRGIKKTLPFKRMVLVAAAVVMALALVGCGVAYLLQMQDLKLGEGLVDRERWDQEKQTVITQTVPQQVLTLSGLKGSPNYQAVQEWYEFEKTYDPDYQKFYAQSDDPFEPAREYDFYGPYTQEMVDKIDEICGKYGLKLIGERVKAQTADDMREYLGIESVLLPGVPASEIDPTAEYYEGGYFRSDFSISMEPGEGVWPYKTLMGYLYSPKDCFNDDLFKLEGSDWQERNYTTKSGHEVLILRSPTVWESWVFCDMPDATITIRMETIHEVYTDEHGYQEVIQTPMTDEQLNQVLDAIDFDLKPNPGDPAVLEGQKASETLSQTSNGYTVDIKDVYTDGYRILLRLGITAPEDVDLEQYLDEGTFPDAQLRFGDRIKLSSYSLPMPNYGGGSMGVMPDNDGKANTVDYCMDMEAGSYAKDSVPYPQGGKINLLLNGLKVEVWNDELIQMETLLEIDGVWNFDITLENGDWREVEFISEPIVTTGTNSWDANGNDIFKDITLTSLKLRALGGDFFGEWEHSQPDICDYRNDKFPTLTLKDGSTIQLIHGLEPYEESAEGEELRIPLDEIENLTLIDGTVLTPVSTVTPVSQPKQTQNGYTLTLKSAVTDGRTARIILGVTAPEGTVLSRKDGIYDMFGAVSTNFGAHTILIPEDGRNIWDYGISEHMHGLEDGDGKENTVDILFMTEVNPPPNGAPEIFFEPGTKWTVHLEGITMDRAEYPERELSQVVPLFSNEDTWDLSFTFDEATDTREIEFLSEPMPIRARIGGPRDPLRDLTMESFRLSALQLRVVWKDDWAGNLFDYASEPYKIVTVVMKEGTRVPLDGTGDYTISDYVNPIDLDEVDFVELIDGTVLYPQG